MNDAPEPKHRVVSAAGTAMGISSASAVIRTRFNLAVQQMMAAARFSRMVAVVENNNRDQPFGDFWDEILQLSMACVFSSVASIESYANELFADRETAFPGNQPRVMDKLWELYEQKRIIEKFEIAVWLREKSPMNTGDNVYQEMKLLIDLRNALVHFKPEWSDEEDDHKRLSNRLRGRRFTPSPFLDDKLLFPRRWATHSCTRWAVKSALAFAVSFEVAADLPPKYSRDFRDRLQV